MSSGPVRHARGLAGDPARRTHTLHGAVNRPGSFGACLLVTSARNTRQVVRLRLLAAPRTASATCGRLACTEDVRRSEVVPATTLTDLDHVDPEFAVFGCHLCQLWSPLYPSRVLSEFVSVHVGDMREVGLAADRAPVAGCLAVELGRAQQVRVRVADV